MESKNLREIFSSYHLPRLNEIPDLELYMDQVIIYVKKYFSIFPYASEQNFITPSMINNYVKSGLIPAPVGKKYNKRHIAYILVIFFLKQVFSLEEVKAFIYMQIKWSNEDAAYEQFCDFLDNELKRFVGTTAENSSLANASSADIALFHATRAIVNKLYSQATMKVEFFAKK